MLIEDIRILEILNNPMRLQILYQLREPRTVRELAEVMAVPVTRLYHHVNLLERADVLEVVEIRKSGARLQRVYRATATRFEPGPRLLENIADKHRIAEVAAGMVLDGARLDAVAGILASFDAVEGADTPDEVARTLGRCVVRLSPEGALAFQERLEALSDEMSEMEDTDGQEYALSIVFFPMVGPVRGDRL